jgi:GT2 family glycosyltransferase
VKQSVVLCTRNRAASLARTLDSLARAEPPRRADFEVVIVDNGSADDTPRVIASFEGRLPLRAVVEPREGISHARNAGVAAAGGGCLIWTDDDVTVCRDWLRCYERAFEAHPRAAFFGGPIRVRLAGAPPAWLRKGLPRVASAFAALEVPVPSPPLDASSRLLPFGANMAVRAAEQRRHAFDASLGRQPWRHGLLSGEETDVLRRIAASGGTGVWVPEASVEHWIEPERQTVDYLRRYYVGMGYTVARRAIAKGRDPLGGGRRRLHRRMAWKRALYLTGRLCGRTELWLEALRRGAQLRGRLLAQREALAAPPPAAKAR